MVNHFILEWFCVNGKLSCRHRNVLKSMRKVKALSWLAGGKPRGCNVGIYLEDDGAVAKATALFVEYGFIRKE